MRVLIFLCVAGPTMLAQSNWVTPRFSPGVTVGVEAGRVSAGSFQPEEESKRWAVGPSIDISLAGNWSVAINPLYQRLGNSYRLPPTLDAIPDGSTFFSSQRLRAHALEVPFIGKYYSGNPSCRVRLFAGTGYAFRTAWVDSRIQLTERKGNELVLRDSRVHYRTAVDTGVVAALRKSATPAGMQTRSGTAIRPKRCLRSAGEGAETRWNHSRPPDPQPPAACGSNASPPPDDARRRI